jgi:hypothetical protein
MFSHLSTSAGAKLTTLTRHRNFCNGGSDRIVDYEGREERKGEGKGEREGEGESKGGRKSRFSVLLLVESAILLMRHCVTTD